MGTRSITHIHEMDSLGSNVVCSFYRQFDGYPTGHGDDLAKWLEDKALVNGIGSGFVEGSDHNRAGSMAIDLLHDLKKDTSVELIPTESSGMGEEFVYHVFFSDEFSISCNGNYSGKEFKARASEFDGEKVEEIFSDE